MYDYKKGIRIKIILLIVSICFSFLFIILFSILKDIPILSLLFKEYVEKGVSFFLPMIPDKNLFPYIPNGVPNHFTIGHLIDILILVNITVYIESSVYHYLKKGLLNKREGMIFHLMAPIENCACNSYQSQDIDSNKINNKDNLVSNFSNFIPLRNKESYQVHKKVRCMILNLNYLKTQYQKIYNSFKSLYKRQKKVCPTFLSSFSFLSEYLIENLYSSFLNKKNMYISGIIINCEG